MIVAAALTAALALGSAHGALLPDAAAGGGASTPAAANRAALQTLPAAPVQGDTLAVLVSAPASARVFVSFRRATLAAYPLALTPPAESGGGAREAGSSRPAQSVSGTDYRALFGTDPDVQPGAYAVAVTITEGDGAARHLSGEIHLGSGKFGVRRLTLPPKTFGLITARNLALESRVLGPVLGRRTPTPWWRGPFEAPVSGPIDSPYGIQGVYNGHREWWHAGVDFEAPEGAPVRAAAAGIVALARALPLGGNTVVIDHGQGVLTEYLHLSAFAVRVGERVGQGTVIGRIGATGLVTGPSLHWGLYVSGLPVDPLFWLVPHAGLTAP